MSFERRTEDFVCEKCGTRVEGNGYTNHCPTCLWSKHVDIHPGDRAEKCGGMMRPVRVEGTATRYRIVHHCLQCGKERIVDTAPGDSKDALVALAGRQAGGSMQA